VKASALDMNDLTLDVQQRSMAEASTASSPVNRAAKPDIRARFTRRKRRA
jgi:hypothetical protein